MFAVTGVQYFILFMAFYRQVCLSFKSTSITLKYHAAANIDPLAIHHLRSPPGLLEEEVGGEGGQERQLRPGDGERAAGQRAHEHPRQRRRDGHQATQVGLNRLYQHYCMEEHSLEALTTMTVFEYL